MIPQILLFALLASCQTAFVTDEVQVTYKLFGEPDFEKEKKVRKKMARGLESGKKSKKKPKILIDSIPEGLNYRDGILSVVEGYNHKIISKFALTKDVDALLFSAYWIVNYENDFLNVYCNAQAPLKVVTLGIWMMYSPTYWVCFPRIYYTQETALDHVRYLAEIAGSDLILTNFLTRETADPDDLIDVVSLHGFLVKVDPKLKGKKLKTKPQVFKANEKPKK